MKIRVTQPLLRRRRGRRFTLVELMVVIAIIGLLAAVVTVNVIGQMGEARKTKVMADMESIQKGIKLFQVNMGYYPQQLQDLWQAPANAGNRWKGPYLEEFPPKDPWGNEYQFESGRPPIITSYGADGQPGGADEATDLRSDTIRDSGNN